MPLRVVWLYQALDHLAAAYLYARRKQSDPEAITRAMAEVDRALEQNADSAGESRSGNSRILIERPISVFFEIHREEGVAIVTSVRYHGRTS